LLISALIFCLVLYHLTYSYLAMDGSQELTTQGASP
jgi:hypothetical protein